MKQQISASVSIEQRGQCWRVLDGHEVIVIVRGRNAAYEAATRLQRQKKDQRAVYDVDPKVTGQCGGGVIPPASPGKYPALTEESTPKYYVQPKRRKRIG